MKNWIFLLLIACASLKADTATLVPRKTFFSNPEKVNAQLSPDGKTLSYLSNVEGVLNIWIQSLHQADVEPLTFIRDRSIAHYCWMPSSQYILFLRDFGGDENDQLFSLNLDTKQIEMLTPRGTKSYIVRTSDRDPDSVILAINARDRSAFDLYKLNIQTKEETLLFQNTEQFVDYLVDDDLCLRAGISTNDEGGRVLHVFEEGAFTPVATYEMDDAKDLQFVTISPNGDFFLFTESKDHDKSGLKKYHFATKTIEPIFHQEEGNCDLVICDPHTREPEIYFTYFLKQKSYTLKQSAWSHLQNAFTGRCIHFIYRSNQHPYWLISSSSDRSPIHYHLYNEETDVLTHLFSSNPSIDALPLAKTTEHLVRARDGLLLPTYVTLPEDTQSPLPTVLLVHGGPWARDTLEYHPIRQFLVNRGYAVLNVNYRGSGGLGKRLLNAGKRQWANKMHDDLIDTVEWAIAEGFTQRDKVAIAGGSYGGYATLVGLTFTPTYFAAGVDIVGPSHVKTLLNTIPPYWKSVAKEFEIRIGSLDDPQYLDSISPLTYVDRICRPLLILQGQNDPRVKCSESDQIVQAMKAKSLPVTYGVFPDEGHGFRMEKNRIAGYAMMEAFLSQHLGGDCESSKEAIRESSVQIPIGNQLLLSPPPAG